MLEALRKWGKRNSTLTHQVIGRTRNPGQSDREFREATVANLRSEISRIQHDISDLDAQMSGETTVASSTQDAQMARLHNELAATQRELGKYQARI